MHACQKKLLSISKICPSTLQGRVGGGGRGGGRGGGEGVRGGDKWVET